MDFSELYISVRSAAATLADNWLVKMIGASAVGAVCSMHGQLLMAFCGLVILDLLTKWVALSKKHLSKRRKRPPTTWECVKNIPNARKAGYIKSEVMKNRFLGKIIVYMLIVFGAALVDQTMETLQNPTWAASLAVGYLAVTELVSILENLQDAGVEEAEKLHDFVEKKRNAMK